MGKEIVYCGGCGKSLFEDDFSKGRAHTIDHRPFCVECKAPAESRPSNQNQTSSRLAALSKSSTARHLPAAAPNTTRRRQAGDSSKVPLIVGGALVGMGLLLLVLFLSASGGKPAEIPPPVPAPPPRTAASPTRAPAPKEADRAAAAIKELEAFAALSPKPVALIQRCDEARPVIAGTPYERALKLIEDRAREAHRVMQVEDSLKEVKKLRGLDPEFDRKEEIVGLLHATMAFAGPRKGEIEELLRAYEKDAEAFARKPAPKPLIVNTGTFGPFEPDSHGAINHWLVLGPFANRNHREGLYDHDLLRPELKHVPAAGLLLNTRETAKVRWTPVLVGDGRVLFRKLDVLGSEWKTESPAIGFAACWLVFDKDTDVKFKVHAERGYYLILDEKRVRNQASGHLFTEAEDVFSLKLTGGPHLLLFKVAATDALFALRARVTTPAGDPVPGLKVWNQPPLSRRVLTSEFFNEGPGTFTNGELVEGGIDGTKAYAIGRRIGGTVEAPFKTPVTAETTVRLKIKPLFEVKNVHAMLWNNTLKINCWYHLPMLKKDEWNVVEFKVAAVRGGYNMKGPSLEGEIPARLTIYHDDPISEGVILIDDFEILE